MTTPKSSADPVGAAMTRDEIIEALRDLVEAVTTEVNEKGAGGYLLARLSDARDALKSSPSAPPVQAITEAMVEALEWIIDATNDPDASEESALDQINERAIEALAIVRLAPSDDAQMEDEPRLPCDLKVGHANFRKGVAVRVAQLGIDRLAARVPEWPDSATPSTLAEFRETCAKACKEYPGWEADACAAAIRALPIPEPWRPIETAPRDGTSIWIINASGYQCQSWWDERFQCWGDPDDPNSPTHWMPLPVPPAKEPK